MNEGARIQSADNDLWLVIPEERADSTGKEAIAEWEEAVNFAYGVTGMVEEMGANPATKQVAHDARARSLEQLRRARERVGETR